jgi:hypothetical protein
MKCVTTVQHSICFNNEPLQSFTPSRGLRQGVPLSPYLFLFVADGLSQIMQHEVQCSALKELQICRRAPGISHLLFVYDTLFFPEATETQAEIIKNALRLYEKCTGQLINPAKCSMMFGTNCSEPEQNKVKEFLEVQTTALDEKYLGLPTLDGRMNKEKFKRVKECLAKHFTNWAEKYMSMGVKEVLISVAQAIPTYVMGVFKLPRTMCNKITQMIRYF